MLTQLGENFEREVTFIETSEPDRPDERRWNDPRIHHMVGIRNLVLAKVREMEPEFFLSLDSDVLLAPQGISTLFEAIERIGDQRRKVPFDVMGGKCYLSWPTRTLPSYAMYSNQNLLRPDAGGGVFPCDFVFAIKLMRPSAYAIDYCYHRLGEDVGWAMAVRQAGGVVGWDGRVTSKHVMHPQSLDVIDERCGF